MYSTVPSDYTAASGRLSFSPSSDGTECAEIQIADDDELEPRESFRVFFTPNAPGSQPSTSTVNIEDDDQIGRSVCAHY